MPAHCPALPSTAHCARSWTLTQKAWHQMTTAPLGRCAACPDRPCLWELSYAQLVNKTPITMLYGCCDECSWYLQSLIKPWFLDVYHDLWCLSDSLSLDFIRSPGLSMFINTTWPACPTWVHLSAIARWNCHWALSEGNWRTLGHLEAHILMAMEGSFLENLDRNLRKPSIFPWRSWGLNL